MRASLPETTDRSFDVLFELEGHPLPTFVARLPNAPISKSERDPSIASEVSELVVVERHLVTGESRTALLHIGKKLEQFRHPHLMAVAEILDTIGVISVVSAYVDGELLSSLDDAAHARGRPVDLRMKIRILLDVLEGLSAFHGLDEIVNSPQAYVGTVPSRVVVGLDGRCRVVHLQCPPPSPSDDPSVHRFLAPEVLAQAPARMTADVYSVGVMLWEALTGTTFDPSAPNVRVREPWAEPLADVAMRALARDPNARIASAAELASEIRAVARDHVVGHDGVAVTLRMLCGQHIAARRARFAAACSTPCDTTPPSLRSEAMFAEVEPATSPAAVLPWPAEDATKPGVALVPPQARVAVLAPTEARSPAPPPLPGAHLASAHASAAIPTPLASLAPTSTSHVGSAPALPIAATTARPPAYVLGDSLEPASAMTAPFERKRGRTVAVLSGVAAIAAALAIFLTSRNRTVGPEAAAPAPSHAMVGAASINVAAPKSSCPDTMVAIGGGTFVMSSEEPDASGKRKQGHTVTLQPYCVDKFEVSVARFKTCSDNGECKRAHVTNDWLGITPADRQAYDAACTMSDPVKYADRPVTCVDWERADIFCKAKGGHLPTEAQWEFAARGAEDRPFPWGADAPAPGFLNACGKECTGWGAKNHVELMGLYDADDGWPLTAPVGSFPKGATPESVHDLAGNVAEWTADWFGPYPTGDQADPTGPPNGEARVVRGGGWNTAYAARVTTTVRSRDLPAKRSYNLGFRCAAPLHGK